jgi:hypothetical protein
MFYREPLSYMRTNEDVREAGSNWERSGHHNKDFHEPDKHDAEANAILVRRAPVR